MLLCVAAGWLWAAAGPAARQQKEEKAEGTRVRGDPSPIRRVVSSVGGLRLSAQPPVQWGVDSGNNGHRAQDGSAGQSLTVTVDAGARLQTMRGFGASFTESGAILLNSLPVRTRAELMDALFSDAGASFSAMKAPMASDDFFAAGPWYTYDDWPGDVNLTNFTIARDLRANGTLTFVLRAKQHGFNGYIQSYMDYPPDWMLKGKLPDATVDPKYYDVLAEYYAKYVQSYAAYNVTINYLSLFNEPTGYTNIYPPAMAKLLGQHVGPLFDSLGLRNKTKLTYGGAVDRATAALMTPFLMENKASRQYMDHIAYHGYDCNYPCTKGQMNYEAVAAMHGLWPDLEIWMTEICYAYGAGYPRNTSIAPALPRLDFRDGAVWGSRITNDVAAGASGWIYWNVILDMHGGPFLLSPSHGDGDGNWQQAVAHVDAEKGEYHLTGLYYYLAHFSKFVRPGAVHVRSTLSGSNESARKYPEGAAGAEAVAFVDDGGKQVVLQLLNNDDADASVTVNSDGRSASFVLPAASITTASWTLGGAAPGV